MVVVALFLLYIQNARIINPKIINIIINAPTHPFGLFSFLIVFDVIIGLHEPSEILKSDGDILEQNTS